jgi:hypothetical protein
VDGFWLGKAGGGVIKISAGTGVRHRPL